MVLCFQVTGGLVSYSGHAAVQTCSHLHLGWGWCCPGSVPHTEHWTDAAHTFYTFPGMVKHKCTNSNTFFCLLHSNLKTWSYTVEILSAVCGGVPEGWHVHQRQRPVQNQVCWWHVHSHTDRSQPEWRQPSTQSSRQGSSKRQEEQTAHQLIAAFKMSEPSYSKYALAVLLWNYTI